MSVRSPTAGPWSSSQWRPDHEFETDRFLHALFGIMRLDLSAPDYTTLSRRSQHLRRRLRPVPTGEGLHLVLDSTGLSIVGAGEWRPRNTVAAAGVAGGSFTLGRSVRRDPCPHVDRGDG